MKKFFYKSILGNLALAFCLAAVFYIPEWIFQRTGNMPLSAFAPSLAWLSLSMGLFLFSGLFGAALFTVDLVCFATPKIQRILKILIVSGILTVTALLLANNFTNTIWAVSISAKSGAPWVNYYRAGLVIVFAYALIEISGLARKPLLARPRLWLTTSIVAVLSFAPAISYSVYSKFAPSGLPQKFTTSLKPEELPNILFLQGDGINAANMSIYGYERKTTPFLDSIKDRVNVWTNFYPSNCCTYGSIYALLTGISPLKHGIFYPPAQVPPEEASWSLPDILKSIGYTTYQDTVPYYADAAFMGLTTAFDITTETVDSTNPMKFSFLKIATPKILLLARPAARTLRRIQLSLVGAFRRKTASDGLDNVRIDENQTLHPDAEKRIRGEKFFKSSRGPWFAQIHFMGTHGPRFVPRQSLASAGLAPQINWQREFYDDAIRDWDSDVKSIIASIQAMPFGRKTYVYITSDHGSNSNSAKKVPLLTLVINKNDYIKPLFPQSPALCFDSLHTHYDIPLSVLGTLGIQERPLFLEGKMLGTCGHERIIVSARQVHALAIDDYARVQCKTCDGDLVNLYAIVEESDLPRIQRWRLPMAGREFEFLPTQDLQF